ncbi:MAG: biliverdin-producing heme oxygenase [Capsulimonas sp.]|uniref:biliverdin-producing heme oxygenase n=1 Tax=Capsulimonas sp. TaxID=2494211 RepID=UPI003264237A
MSIELLRLATRPDHQQMEDRLDIRAQCATPHSYRRLLERFYGFYRPYETALKSTEGFLPPLIDLAARTRLPSLASDLRAMGLSEDQCSRLPECPDAPRPKTRAEALGCLYVTEGSTLGGQIIRRMIQETYGTDALPTAFFDGYGAQTGRRWRDLCAAVDGADLSGDDRDAMTSAARRVFRTLETWLCAEPSDKNQKEDE